MRLKEHGEEMNGDKEEVTAVAFSTVTTIASMFHCLLPYIFFQHSEATENGHELRMM